MNQIIFTIVLLFCFSHGLYGKEKELPEAPQPHDNEDTDTPRKTIPADLDMKITINGETLTLKSGQVEELSKKFSAINENKDGSISANEIKNSIAGLDTNNDNQISGTELDGSSVNWPKILSNAESGVLKDDAITFDEYDKIFNAIDLNENGKAEMFEFIFLSVK